MEIIFAGIMIVFMVIFLVMMWTIYSGMKKFLTDNIEEALVVSGDYIGDRVKDLHSTMTGRMNALENENRTLREEITRQLDAISSIIADADGESEIGINSIVKELNDIIPALRNEITKLLKTLSENAESFQKSTVRNLEAEISKLIMAVKSLCGNVTQSANEQSKIFADIAGTVQGVMGKGAKNLESEFGKAHSEIRNIITDSTKQINTDYQDNMKQMFTAMADNLSAIIQQLRSAGTNAELPANAESNPPAENTSELKQEKPRRGRPRTKTISENPKKAKENTPEKVTDKANDEAANNAA